MTLPFPILMKCNVVIASEAILSDEIFLIGVYQMDTFPLYVRNWNG